MDIGSAFTYVFDDEEWIKKLAIGGGIALGAIILLPVLLIGLVLFLPLNGYMLQVVKNVRDGQTNPLPEWDDFGGYFKTGFFVAVIWFIYNIPAILFSCVGSLAQNAPAMMDMDSDMAGVVVSLAVCLNCVQIILSLAAAILLPAAIIRFAQYDTMGSAFQFGAIFSFISGNIGDYIIVILLSLVAGIVAGFGLILCIIGVFFTLFWSMLVKANLYGQLARKAQSAV
jgi:hypothetical protein